MKRYLLPMLILILTSPYAGAQDFPDKDFYILPHIFSEYSEDFLPVTEKNPVSFSVRQAAQQTGSQKSPLKAAVLSLILPGAGQYYAGSLWKAVSFVSVECSMWFGHNHFNGEGDTIDREFRAYADEHWCEEDYTAWLNAQDPDVQDAFSHTLPSTKTQQYYEMIGKYNQFLAGWPDSNGSPQESTMRLYYMTRQDASNKEYKRAELLAQLMILNRVVSAAEAAISVYRKNSHIRTGLTFKIDPAGRSIMPLAHIALKW